MDIRWVLAKPHFTVKVTKVPDGAFIQSRLPWDGYTLHLDTNDFTTRTMCFGPERKLCVSQVPVAHEFGHSLGTVLGAMPNKDEYRKKSDHYGDIHSIMHRGSQVRARHFEQLLTELFELIPETTFRVGRTQ